MKRFAVGTAATLPIIYLIVFFAIIFPALSKFIRADAEHGDPVVFQRVLIGLGVVHITMMLMGLVVLAYFLVLLYRIQDMDPGRKTIWALALFFGNVLVLPLFWYFYVGRRTRTEGTSKSQA